MSVRPPARSDPKPAGKVAAKKAVSGKAVTALNRSRLRPIRPLKLRLIDAVTLAAAGLLVLKLAALSIDTPPVGAELPSFARVLAKARTGYEPFDPTTTGSISPKESKPDAAKPEARSEPPQAQPPMAEPVSPSERALLEKLGARRDALKQKSDELELREKMLGEAERKLETGLGDLKQAEEKADTSGKGKAEAEKAGLKSLVTMYETMKPKDAARVFDRLGHDVLVPLVLAMNPRKMAEVLAVMQADAAEKLTVALANRARGVAGPQAAAGGALGPNELPAIERMPGDAPTIRSRGRQPIPSRGRRAPPHPSQAARRRPSADAASTSGGARTPVARTSPAAPSNAPGLSSSPRNRARANGPGSVSPAVRSSANPNRA